MLPSSWGQISLQVSFLLYVCMLVPQLLYNIRRRSVKGLSWYMHLILLVGSTCDLGYGLGRAMPWQYFSVSLLGVILLSVQHVQFFVYQPEEQPRHYARITIALLIWAVILGIALTNRSQHQDLFMNLGYCAIFSWLTNSIPQILENRRLCSTEGLSFSYVMLGMIAMSADTISAYSLNWGLPNKIGSPVSICLQSVMLAQFWIYRRQPHGRFDRQENRGI